MIDWLAAAIYGWGLSELIDEDDENDSETSDDV